MTLIDTHCHVHWKDYGVPPDELLAEAAAANVTRLICVGTSLPDSKLAVGFAARHRNAWASVGIHPHDASKYVGQTNQLKKLVELAKSPKVIAIGETGLDYHYNHSPKQAQQELLKFHLDLAKETGLPLIFHIREAQHQDKPGAGQAFDDFWAILADYPDVKGVLHSFTADTAVLTEALKRGLFIGLNGIVTFAKDDKLMAAAKAVPLEHLLLETDAPFLTPAPYRGTICQPKHVEVIARYLSDLRGGDIEELATSTTKNALKLFNLR